MPGHEGAWAFFNDLLMPPLDGAFSLSKVDSISKAIAKDLHLDMVAVRVEALHERSSVLEQGFTPGFHGREGAFDFVNIAASRKPHATTTCRGLQHDWKPKSFALFDSIFFPANQAI